jgi:hypothetical protein
MLSPLGVECIGPEDPAPYLIMCAKCWFTLERGALPRFAINNGFAIGQLPDMFKQCTPTERALVRWHYWIGLIVALHRVKCCQFLCCFVCHCHSLTCCVHLRCTGIR